MESTPRIAASLSDTELAQLLTVLHRADSVELKATVDRGVELSEVQATKTRKALEYFAGQLSRD